MTIANLGFIVCKQAIFGSLVISDFQLAFMMTQIERVPGGNENVSNFFLHEVFSNSQDFVDAVGSRNGLRVLPMDSVNVSVVGTNDSPKRETFAFPPSDAHYTVAATYDFQPSGSNNNAYAFVYQASTGELRYFDLGSAASQNSGDCQVVFGDNSYWSSKSDVPAHSAGYFIERNYSGMIEFHDRVLSVE